MSRENSPTTSTTDTPPRPDDGTVCPICGGLGRVTRAVPVDHPDFGKSFPCRCQHDALAARQNARLRTMSNLAAVENKTFDAFMTDLHNLSDDQRANLRIAYTAAYSYAQQPAGWLLFQGNIGSGKTHLAAAIANYRLAQNEEVMFVTTADLLDHLRSTFGPSSEIAYDELFERVRNTPLLVLDDLGAENMSGWAQEKLYQLINHRYVNQLNTVITTNIESDQFDLRIRSRLVDRSLTRSVPMNFPDFRRNDADQTQGVLSNLGLYGEMSFQAFDLREGALPENERRNLRQAFEIAQEYAREPQGWLLFMGEHGCGKTHLAAAIALHRHTLGEPVILVTAPDLLDYLRETFNPNTGTTFSKRFYEIRSAPLLVIDQLDLTNASSWTLEKMRQIVDHRYLTHLPTVFTTTQSLDQLDPLIRSRILDARRCHVFAILAPDYRGGQTYGRPVRRER